MSTSPCESIPRRSFEFLSADRDQRRVGARSSRVISHRRRAAILCLLVFASSPAAGAGDAVAIGYNADGLWTAVTYYCSSTPKGGADYRDEAGAREAALRDLQSRAGDGMAKSAIIASSNRTGQFAYARGERRRDQTMYSDVVAGRADVHAVGFGATKEAAARSALAELRRLGGTGKGKIIYSYFSHGAQPLPKPATKSRNERR